MIIENVCKNITKEGAGQVVGEKIKAIRMEKGITAKDLAEKSDVTPGYISQIERNLISPSLSVLMRIAEALSIPLVSLFSQEEQEEVTVIPKDNRTRIQFADINMEVRHAVQPEKKYMHADGNALFPAGAKKLGQYHCAVS